jgi:hypothetical protein
MVWSVWVKRFHTGEDLGFRVQVTVRVTVESYPRMGFTPAVRNAPGAACRDQGASNLPTRVRLVCYHPALGDPTGRNMDPAGSMHNVYLTVRGTNIAHVIHTCRHLG